MLHLVRCSNILLCARGPSPLRSMRSTTRSPSPPTVHPHGACLLDTVKTLPQCAWSVRYPSEEHSCLVVTGDVPVAKVLVTPSPQCASLP